MIFVAITIAAVLIWIAWTINPELGIFVALLSYGAIDGLRSRH